MATVLPDPATPFGERVARRLRDEPIMWLTTVGSDGTPQPNPIWFLWDGENILVYNRADAKRLEHIQRNSKIALHFDGDGRGGNIVVFSGEARLSTQDPSADQNPAYVEKYRDFIARGFKTPENFASLYPVALRVAIGKVRGH